MVVVGAVVLAQKHHASVGAEPFELSQRLARVRVGVECVECAPSRQHAAGPVVGERVRPKRVVVRGVTRAT